MQNGNNDDNSGINWKKFMQFCSQLKKDFLDHPLKGVALLLILTVSTGVLLGLMIYVGRHVLFVEKDEVTKSKELQKKFGNYLIWSGCSHGMIAILTFYCAYKQKRPSKETKIPKHAKTDIIMLVAALSGILTFLLFVMQAACNTWSTDCTEFDRIFFINFASGISILSRIRLNEFRSVSFKNFSIFLKVYQGGHYEINSQSPRR